MSTAKDEMKEYSKRMWLAVTSITVFTLLLVAALIGMSLNANSGVGLPVVIGTFVLGFVGSMKVYPSLV